MNADGVARYIENMGSRIEPRGVELYARLFACPGHCAGALGMMANNPGNLVDTLSMLFMHSQMPTNMRTAIVNAVTADSASGALHQAQTACYLILTSSYYNVWH